MVAWQLRRVALSSALRHAMFQQPHKHTPCVLPLCYSKCGTSDAGSLLPPTALSLHTSSHHAQTGRTGPGQQPPPWTLTSARGFSVSAPKEKNEEEGEGASPAQDKQGAGSGNQELSKFQLFQKGLWPPHMTKASIIAPENYNRWRNVPASFLVQLSIGSVYGFSLWNAPLTTELGVVASAADDWTLSAILPIFSTMAMSLGFTTFFLGPWAEKAGPRMVAAAAATCFSSGLALSALGCHLHQLPLLYAGFGVLGGMGWGLGYISPVSTLMRWFPDRRGLATGLALTAFGGGAAVASPVIEGLLTYFRQAPTFLGSVPDVALTVQGGRQYAEVGGALREAIIATPADLAGFSGALQEGVYLVGTGSTGAGPAFLTLSAAYFTMMTVGAFNMKVPREGWVPAGWSPPSAEEEAKKMITSGSVDHVNALRTPQFYLLWAAVMGNAVAGTSLIASAKTMMTDCFGAALPLLVTGSFASGYVATLSGANAAGRLGWAAASDTLGRKNTYFLFGLGIPVCAGIPYLTHMLVNDPSLGSTLLPVFYCSTAAVVSFYGGLFSTLPAYLADVFGQKHVGAIHGRLLTAWSAAALTGPSLLTLLRKQSYDRAITSLVDKVPPAEFERAFGAPVSQLPQLIEAKTVTIPRLLEACPVGTVDPTPMLYDTTMTTICGLLSAAFVCNALIRPVDKKFFIPDTLPTADEKAANSKS